MNDPANLVDLIAALGVFALIFGLWQAILLLTSHRELARQKALKDRLGIEPGKRVRTLRLWHGGQEKTTDIAIPVTLPTLVARTQKMCDNAGFSMSAQKLLLIIGIGGLAGFLVGFLFTQRIFVGAIAALAVVMLFHVYVQHRVNKRASLFERQLLDALYVAVTSLRAGHPVNGAFRFISTEINAPVGPIFGEICHRQELGANLEEVLKKAADDSGNAELQLFATSVTVQLRSGGNLADMMERLAGVMRERMNVSRRLRVLTAQAQLSKRVLLALPVVFFALLNIVNPTYMEPLYSTNAGKMMLAIAAVMMLIGVYVMNYLARPEF